MAVTECRELPDLSLDFKEGNYDDVHRLLQEIKPTWDKNRIQVKKLSGGASCHMLRCSQESGESVTVRVRNAFDGLRDPMYERQVVKVLSSKGCFPPLLAIFANGFCYEYIQGRPFVTKDSKEIIIDEDILRLIAEGLANLQAVVVPEFDYKQSPLFDFVTGLMVGVNPCFEGCPPTDEVIQEIRLVEELVSVVKSPLVLLHGDSHLANMVWNEKESKVTYVDLELSLVGPRAYDIAYFMHTFDGVGSILNIPVMMPDDKERKFCTHYLRRWNSICGKSNPTENEIEQLLQELKYFMLAVRIVRFAYMLKFSHLLTSVGRLLPKALSDYRTTKNALYGMTDFGRPKPECKSPKLESPIGH